MSYECLLRNKRFRQTLASCARAEKVPAKDLAAAVAAGRAVILQNTQRRLRRPCAIGKGLSTKINVNIGTSPERPRLDRELKKLEAAVELGADAVMDLSLGGDLKKNRQAILDRSPIPVGTVPIYEAAVRIQKKRGSFLKMETGDLLDVLWDHAAGGVDFMTIHCGINRRSLKVFLARPRVMGVVRRGGALLVNWMRARHKENPLYDHFDEVLKIARSHNVTLSLGDGMRPGSVCDATDKVQLSELQELGKLVRRCRQAGVQVIVEGPGHVPLDQIEENMRLEK
jgi:phosphomethylpyrimidine synthase